MFHIYGDTGLKAELRLLTMSAVNTPSTGLEIEGFLGREFSAGLDSKDVRPSSM